MMLQKFSNLAAATMLTTALSAQADPLDAIASMNNMIQAASVVDILSMLKKDVNGHQLALIIPKLKISADCTNCKFGNASRMLMLASYNEMAQKHKIDIDKSHELHFVVTSVIARPSILRGTFGVLSGADFVRGHFEGESKYVGKFSISHEMGIDEVTQKLGEALFIEALRKQLPETPGAEHQIAKNSEHPIIMDDQNVKSRSDQPSHREVVEVM